MKKLRRGSFTRKYLKRISKKNSKLKKSFSCSCYEVSQWAFWVTKQKKKRLSITEGTSKPCCSSLSSNWLRKVRKIQRCPRSNGIVKAEDLSIQKNHLNKLYQAEPFLTDETKLLRGNRPDFERYVCVHRFEIITDRHNNDAVLFGHLEHHWKFSGVRNYNEKPRHEVYVPWDLQTAFFVKLLWALS